MQNHLFVPRKRGGGDGWEPYLLEQFLEAGLVAEGVHAGIDVEIEEPVGVILVGLFEVVEGLVILAEADVNSGEEVRRDVLMLSEFQKIVEDLKSIARAAGFCTRMRESCAHQRAAP